MLLNEAVNRSHSAAKRSVVHFLQTSTYERQSSDDFEQTAQLSIAEAYFMPPNM